MALVSLVIINYNNRDFLERCMESILRQTYKDIEIIFIDNQSSDQSYEFMKEKYGGCNDISIIYNELNNGYAGGANQGIHLAKGEYICILNPDIILEEDFIEKIQLFMQGDPRIGAVSGKLLKYDFDKNKKLNYIDSAGIIMSRSTNSFDRGQNEYDYGQYNEIKQVFGVCGAAAFYRKSALEEVRIMDEYFDNDFFAYKEDVDISWRLNLIGFKNMYYPMAIAYHGRGLGKSKEGVINFIKGRKEQSKFLRGISYRNRILMIIKNNVNGFLYYNLFYVIRRELSFLIYAIIFEPFILKYFIQALKMRKKMITKKNILIQKHGNNICSIKNLL